MSLAPPRWSEVTALYGGSFDPPHLGHREAVRGLFERPGVGRVWILPSPLSPLKSTPYASAEQRSELVRLGFGPSRACPLPPEVRLDFREVERTGGRPGLPAYTYDTLQEVKREVRLPAFVVGTDGLANLHRWHRFPELLSLAHWIILLREPNGDEDARRVLADWQASGLARPAAPAGSEPATWRLAGGGTFLTLVPTPAPDLSSTRIRESLARSGAAPPQSLTPEVMAYLKLHRIYGSSGAND